MARTAKTDTTATEPTSTPAVASETAWGTATPAPSAEAAPPVAPPVASEPPASAETAPGEPLTPVEPVAPPTAPVEPAQTEGQAPAADPALAGWGEALTNGGGVTPPEEPNVIPGYNPADFEEETPTVEIVENDAGPSLHELLTHSMALDVRIAADEAKREAASFFGKFFVGHEQANTPVDFAVKPGEKARDDIGSTHDITGKAIVAPGAPEGEPGYVGTNAPTPNPSAGWTDNA